tara:strand:+ start:248 stop:736 length:489 start_codon:yes stop_codon:yes gene_type:complete
MFNKKIIGKDKQGRICEYLIGEPEHGSIDDEIQRVLKICDHDEKTNVLEVDLDEPSSAEDPRGDFQAAWEFDDDKRPTKIVVNLDKAKKDRVNHLRGMRNVVLKSLDQDMIVALGKGDTKSINKIEKRKELLRDLPSNIKAPLNKCKSLDELREVVPPELIY